MDIMPTFLELAGVAPPQLPKTDGLSVAAMVERGAASPHRELFWGYRNQRAVREGAWKLILHPPSVPGDVVKDDIWLSNVSVDPGEKVNYAARERGIVQRLQARIEQWTTEVKA
jgi:arylsulfatase A-like enzyme